jgi:crotonobetaine/carnitine-CoA ligase
MKIVGENGSECAAGETGELLFRFQDGTSGVEYLEEPPASGSAEPDGWYRTGDMVHQDQQGWFFYDYRKGQELRHHGEFIAAGDVETVLLAHPEVRDACVYGIDSDSEAPGEQDLVAAIVPAGKGTPDINGIFVMCTNRLPAAAVPSYIQLIDALPRTPTEKVIRRLIKERFEADSPYVYRFNDEKTRSAV